MTEEQCYEAKCQREEHDAKMKDEGFYDGLEEVYKRIKKVSVYGLVKLDDIEDILDDMGYDYLQCQ